ncbi:hypothetical protein MSPP1_001828 [Malassezia sp. CBS 17886]|nr:hypothetical protein MSPP1_001828 [Malassezia sp. CBS 17886]
MAPPTPHPLVIECAYGTPRTNDSTDPGVDDLIAILLALASPEVTLEAITLTFGNTTLDYAYSNMLRLAHALEVTAEADPSLLGDTLRERVLHGIRGHPIPIALGATKPLGGKLFTASYFHGRDGMSGVSFLPEDPFPEARSSQLFSATPSPLPADEQILDVLRKNPPHTVRIAAVAPLTNLASAFLKDPDTFRRVGMISVMGGALDVPGNTSPCAEFNFFADPWAAKVILEDAAAGGQPPLPVYLFPLDITSTHTVPYSTLVRDELDAFLEQNYLASMISKFLRKPRAVTNSFAIAGTFDPAKHDLFQAHDPLAVAHAIFYNAHAKENAWKTTARAFLLETDGVRTRGMCIVDRRDHGAATTGRAKTDMEAESGAHDEHGIAEDADAPRTQRAAAGAADGQRRDDGGKSAHASDKDAFAPVHVVTSTPGSDWFADMLLTRLRLPKV